MTLHDRVRVQDLFAREIVRITVYVLHEPVAL